MPIRWKVTTGGRNSCTIWACSFIRRYLQDTIVKADLNSFGIFTFITKRDAEAFRHKRSDWITLKVKTIGRGRKPKKISMYYSSSGLFEFYDPDTYVSTEPPPPGTICYPAVEVLE